MTLTNRSNHSTRKMTKSQLVEEVVSLRTANLVLNTTAEELAAKVLSLSPKPRRTDTNTFAGFCTNNPSLPRLLQPGQAPCSRAFCPTCDSEVPTNQFGVCRTCAINGYREQCSQKAAA